MKNLGKKLSMIILAITLLLCSVFAVACAEKPAPTIPPTTATLSHDSLYLEMGEEFQLSVLNPDGEVSWKSGNASVVTVDQTGKLKAVDKGNTLVTATIGKNTLTCDVLVIGSENIPTLTFSGIETVSLLLNDSYKLAPRVFFDGKYYDAEYSFKIYDESVASVTKEGLITALSYGKTEVEVTATWKEYSNDLLLTEIIPVQVNKDVFIKTNIDRTLLYTEEFTSKGVTYYDTALLTSSVKVEGVEFVGEINYVSTDEQILTVENGQVKALSAGQAQVYIEFTVEGETYTSNPLTVEVKKPFEYTGKNFLLDRASQLFALDGVEPNVQKVRVLTDANTLEITEFTSVENAVSFSGEYGERIKSTSAVLALETSDREYYYNITLADVMIEDCDGFALFVRDVVKYTGLCVGLAKDLDFAGYDYTRVLGDRDYSNKYVTSKSASASAGLASPFNTIFSGILDGGGHVIKNLNINGYLFNTVQKATIRNIGFVNANYTSTEAQFIFQTKIDSGETKFENVYFHSVGGGSSYDVALVQVVYGGSSIVLNNSVIDRTHAHAFRLSYFGNLGGGFVNNNSYSIGNTAKVTYMPTNYMQYKEIFLLPTVLCEKLDKEGLSAEQGYNLSAWNYSNGVLKFGTATVINNPKLVINDAETMKAYLENENGVYDGAWVVLGKDIDMTGYTVSGNGVISGVLDGQGFVVENITYGAQLATTNNIVIKNIGFIVTSITNSYNNGMFSNGVATELNNVYLKIANNGGSTWKDYALFGDLMGNVTMNNVIVDKQHSTSTAPANLTGCLIHYLNSSSYKVIYNNLYSIGNTTTVVHTTTNGAGTGTAIFETPVNALADINLKGLTSANGWNTDIWKITDKGDLTFGKVTVIKVSSVLGNDESDFNGEDQNWNLN